MEKEVSTGYALFTISVSSSYSASSTPSLPPISSPQKHLSLICLVGCSDWYWYGCSLNSPKVLCYTGLSVELRRYWSLLIANIYFFNGKFKEYTLPWNLTRKEFAKISCSSDLNSLCSRSLLSYNLKQPFFLIAHYFGTEHVTLLQHRLPLFSVLLMGFTILLGPLWSSVTDAYHRWIGLDKKCSEKIPVHTGAIHSRWIGYAYVLLIRYMPYGWGKVASHVTFNVSLFLLPVLCNHHVRQHICVRDQWHRNTQGYSSSLPWQLRWCLWDYRCCWWNNFLGSRADLIM